MRPWFSTRKFRQNRASAFRIWREGHPVDWQCTVTELAEATGLPPGTVRRICRERGWQPIEDAEETATPVDVLFRSESAGLYKIEEFTE